MMKRALSILICLMLVLSMATTAFAAQDGTIVNDKTITINNAAVNSVYTLYRILGSSNTGDGYGYATLDKYAPIYQMVFETKTESAVKEKIYAVGNAGAPELAEDFYEAILSYNKGATNIIEADYTFAITEETNTFPIRQGYYLIIETLAGEGGDTYSLYMLDTVGENGLTIYSKESAPEIEKTVYNSNDSKNDSDHSGWGEHATYDIGDEIPYKIIVNLGDTYDSYKTYHFRVEDTMDEGLTFNRDSLSIRVGNINGPDITDCFLAENIVKTDHGFQVSGDLKTVTWQDKDEDGNPVGEVKKLTHNTDVVFVYTATLNESAKVGNQGNKNSAKLYYQNNPYVTENPEYGETPPDITVVHTVKLIINKVDGSGAPIEGMGFTLYKYDDVNTMDYVIVGEEQYSDANGVITFTGLDEGIYKLSETFMNGKPYNKADDINFHIHATYNDGNPGDLVKLEVIGENNQVIGTATYTPNPLANGGDEGIEGQAATQFTVSLDEDSADLEVTIVNRIGTEMPETGGMGTTLIYVIGGILVLAAVILLVTKKRMTNAE